MKNVLNNKKLTSCIQRKISHHTKNEKCKLSKYESCPDIPWTSSRSQLCKVTGK